MSLLLLLNAMCEQRNFTPAWNDTYNQINPAFTIQPQPLMKSNEEKHMLEEAFHEL